MKRRKLLVIGASLASLLVSGAYAQDKAAKQAEVKFLGSYPVAGEEDAQQRREAAGKAWRQAAQWVDDLRGRVAPPGSAT